MTIQISIRHATLEDGIGMLSCLHEAFEPYLAAYTPEGFSDTTLTEETIRGVCERCTCWWR